MSALDELRALSPVLLVADIPPPRARNEDGSPMIFAPDEDVLWEAFEFLVKEKVEVTRDPSQTYAAIVVVKTEGWEKSPKVLRAIQRAKESQVPRLFCDP